MRVLFCGSGWLEFVDVLRARLPQHQVTARDFSRPLEEELATADVILPSNARIGPAQIEGAKAVRLIQQPAAGYDAIDLEAARARGIPVCNSVGTNTQAAAECAILLLLACARRMRATDRTLRLPTIGEPSGVELHGKTLGLIGRGGQGSIVKSIAEAFGMRVLIVHSRSTKREFLDVLAQSDFVSIHCPLNERTRSLFDDRAFAALKQGAHLINVSRGPIIDRAAMERALDHLGGVGLDVLWEEPWDPHDPLFDHPQVVVLPHVAGATREAYDRTAAVVVENIRRIDSGEPLLNRLV